MIADAEGQEASDPDHARELAVQAARDIMRGELKHGALCLSCHIEILDDERRPVFGVAFRDAVNIRGL